MDHGRVSKPLVLRRNQHCERSAAGEEQNRAGACGKSAPAPSLEEEEELEGGEGETIFVKSAVNVITSGFIKDENDNGGFAEGTWQDYGGFWAAGSKHWP